MKNSKTEDRLPEVSIIKLSGKILVSREVVALGGSIVHVYNSYCTVFFSLSFACWSVKTKARGPCLESLGNFSGPKSDIKMEI